jgi:hypothetical protein
MAVIGGESVVLRREFDILANTASVLEAEAEIVCAVRVAVVGCAAVELGGEAQTFVGADSALQANSKTVLGSRVSLLSRQAVVLRRPIRVRVNAFAVFQTAREIEEPIGVGERCRPPRLGRRRRRPPSSSRNSLCHPHRLNRPPS